MINRLFFDTSCHVVAQKHGTFALFFTSCEAETEHNSRVFGCDLRKKVRFRPIYCKKGFLRGPEWGQAATRRLHFFANKDFFERSGSGSPRNTHRLFQNGRQVNAN
jgi:hypothetical protein